MEVFRRHNEEVQRTVPAGQLLVYEVKQGWEPLCRFLGVPVPEGQPFPHLNERETFQRMLDRQEFHVSEMSLASYAALKARGHCPFVAVPVALSRLFRYQLDMFSEQTSIAAKDIVGTPVAWTINDVDNEPRFFHGVVSRFSASKTVLARNSSSRQCLSRLSGSGSVSIGIRVLVLVSTRRVCGNQKNSK